MKKIFLILLAPVMLSACKKEKSVTTSGYGTIVRDNETVVLKTYIIYYSAQDSVIIAGLMRDNNLSTNGLVFYTYQSYNAFDQNNQMGFYQIAAAEQVRNGLPLFFEDITFGFENGKLVGPPPAPQFIAGNITLDNKPNLSLQTLRDSFIKIDNAQEGHNISIKDSTLVAQLGYYNLNINQLAVGGAPSYIKVWYVHPSHWPWPQGYFRDDTGSVISFTPLTHSGPVAP